MTMEKWCEQHNSKVTDEQFRAARFLESRGRKFVRDFTLENVVALSNRLFKEEFDGVMNQ